MPEILLSPLIAFFIYFLLTGILLFIGKQRSAVGKTTVWKFSIYSGGEAAPSHAATPGYRQFFIVALYFAILHLGVLVLGTSNLQANSAIYIIGLILILLALILG